MTTRQFNWKSILLFGTLVLMACLRLVFLAADSPQGPFWVFDEGHWVHNARNAILFHRWVVDDFNQGLIAPVFSALTYFAFQFLGVGLVQARLVSAFMGILTLIAFYCWLRTTWGREEAGLATLLLSASSILFDFNRLAVPETTVLFLLIVAGWLWCRTDLRASYGLASGIAFTLACLTKPTAVFFFPLPFVVWLLKPAAGEQHLPLAGRVRQLLHRPHTQPLGLFLLGCGLVALTGLAAAMAYGVLPDTLAMETLLAWGKRPDSLSHVAFRLIALPSRRFFRTVPVLLMLTSLYLMLRCSRMPRGHAFLKQCTRVEVVALVWLGLGALFMGLVSYYADRYLLVLIPPLCILGGKALAETGAVHRLESPPPSAGASSGGLSNWAFVVLFFAPLLSILWPGLSYLIGKTDFTSVPTDVMPLFMKMLEKFGIGSALLALFAVVAYRRVRRPSPRSVIPFAIAAYPMLVFTWALFFGTIFLVARHVPAGLSEGLSMDSSAALAMVVTLVLALVILHTPLQERVSHLAFQGRALLVAAFLLIDGGQIVSFLYQHTDSVATAARQLRPYLSPGAVILGDMADTLSLESSAVSIRSYLGMNQNAFERFHPDYILEFQEDAPADVQDELNQESPRRSHATHFVQRFYLLPLDRRHTLYGFVIDLYAVEGSAKWPTRFR